MIYWREGMRERERERDGGVQASTRCSANAASKSADMHMKMLKVWEMHVKPEHEEENNCPIRKYAVKLHKKRSKMRHLYI